jgi:deoxyribonuclease-4
MRIGAHESVAGGLHLAFERGVADGAEAIQVFTKSSRQWAAKTLTEEDVQAFRKSHADTGLSVLCHDSYLINLGSEPGEVREKSLAAFRDELERSERLGIPWLVAHPGAHEDETRGLGLIANGIRQALDATPDASVGVLLEITAGQGIALGFRFDHLKKLIDLIDRPERTGVCLDTCHLYAAGYDIATDDGYARTMDELGSLLGFSIVKAMHLNDAKKGLGCRVDRHEFIGEGTLGVATFRRFMQDRRFDHVVAVLETPEGKWKEEIALLKALRDGVEPPALPSTSAVKAAPETKQAKSPKTKRGTGPTAAKAASARSRR